MNMTIYSHGLCYKYEYEEVWHTPKGDVLEYKREWTTIPLVWLWQWAWAGEKIKDMNWVWREDKNYMVIDIGMCMTYSFEEQSWTQTVFTTLYDHPEAIDMLNGVVIDYKISITPSPMSELTNYIKEGINQLRPKLKEAWVSTEYFCISEQISKLQAVLSKIEELWDNLHNKK